MSNRRLLAATVVVILLNSAVMPTAQAADEIFCDDHAHTAVNQFAEAERHERCDDIVRNDQGRWQPDYRAHYDWCRETSLEKVKEERRERKLALVQCTRR